MNTDKLTNPMISLLNETPCALIGMVHLLPLPNSPKWRGDLQAVFDRAERDAETLVKGGCHALLVENMHDTPYLRGHVAPETVAAMAVATAKVTAFGLPTGVQVLAAANREALGVALATGAHFVRVEGFAYSHVADEGWMDACAGELLRVRQSLNCDIRVFADIQKKHSAHAVTADLSLADWAKGAAFFGADGVIVTGTSTGVPTNPEHVCQARAGGLPVLVGSGVTPENLSNLTPYANGLIVGSYIKEDGDWTKPVELARVQAVRQALDRAVSEGLTIK